MQNLTDTAIFQPMLALILLTFLVAIVMYRRRVAFMKDQKIHPQKVQTRGMMAQQVSDTGASDNYQNLLEMPILFYLSLITIYITKIDSLLLVALAWAYVAFRIAHSVIQCSYNKVMHRFAAFILSFIVLAAIWLIVAINLLAGIQL